MKPIQCFFSICLILASLRVYANEPETTISLCMDERLWAPFTFVSNGKAEGTHAAMVRRAVAGLPYEIEIKPAPWKRCLAAAKRGEIDALLSVAHSDEREQFLMFPKDATELGITQQSFGELDFVIVTRNDNEFDADTEKGTPPEPIGLPSGHLAVSRYQEKNRHIVIGSRYLDLFEMLKRRRVNSLVMPSRMVDLYCSLEEYQRIFKKSAQRSEVGSLHLAFSRKGSVSEDQAQKIWQALGQVRTNKSLMHAISEEAITGAHHCLQKRTDCRY